MVSAREILRNARGVGPLEAVSQSLAAVIQGVTLLLIGLFIAVTSVIRTPLEALGFSSGSIIASFGQAVATVFQAGGLASALRLGPRGPFGFLSLPIAVLVGGGSIFILAQILERPSTSDLLPGTFTDINAPEWIPFVDRLGVAEDVGDADEER